RMHSPANRRRIVVTCISQPRPTSKATTTFPRCSVRLPKARPATRTAISNTSRRWVIRPPACRSARPRRTSRPPLPARHTSTATCIRAWRSRRAKRASPRSPTGSRRWPRPSARTRIASRRRSTRSDRAPSDSKKIVSASDTGIREGSLQAPSRHPLDWRNPQFTDEAALQKELERVFDICHGCRRCFSLCNAFPTLFDAIDASETLELDGVDKKVYWDVVDHCYLCDMCFMTKCPYVPPHPWNIDFPHLMLRAKHVQHRKGEHSFRDKLLSNTRGLGNIAGIPVVAEIVNAVNGTKAGRKLLEATLGVDASAPLPKFHSTTGSKRARRVAGKATEVKPTEETRGKVALFVTCYGDRNEPHMPEDLTTVFEHNGIPVKVVG